MEFLLSIDRTIFTLLNSILTNSLFDIVMPFLTDLNKIWFGRILAGILWIALMWKGGARGRTAALLLFPLILLSDQLSSSFIKPLAQRPRPCHLIGEIRVIQNVRLLVDCGSGYSFPSSHAVNNFAAAILFSFFFKKWFWMFISFAIIISYSRIYVGLHYPSDVMGGAMMGIACAFIILGLWKVLCQHVPAISLDTEQHSLRESEVTKSQKKNAK